MATNLERTIAFVKTTLANAEGGHDWHHINRVWKTAKTIAESEGDVNHLVIDYACLLHDIADSKFHNGDESIGPKVAFEHMSQLAISTKDIEHVIDIIKHMSFKGGKRVSPIDTIEFQIVQDADRLDAIGAIGIARAFNYGGHKMFALYDPEIQPDLNMTAEQYKASSAPTINHFYEKLLLLKDRMNTSTAKSMAEQRHRFMETYLDQFYAEWEGKK